MIANLQLEIIGMTIEFLGGIMIAYTAISVHYRFRKEHRIDQNVFNTMRKEQKIGILGIIFLIVGYVVQVIVLF